MPLLRVLSVLAGLTILAVTADTPVAAGGGGCHEPLTDAIASDTGNAVELKDNCFLPTVLRVDAGDAVVFKSHDVAEHTVTSHGVRSGEAGWGDFEPLVRGDSRTFFFEESGIFPYCCLLHPGMIGVVVVGDGTPDEAARTAAVGAPEEAHEASAGGWTVPAAPIDAPQHSDVVYPRPYGWSALAVVLSGAGLLALVRAAVWLSHRGRSRS
jgi:plastocyanin